MHIVFVHQNFPAQFGHIADYLATRHGFRCTRFRYAPDPWQSREWGFEMAFNET